MKIDADLLERFGIDQETFDHLRKTSPHVRAYTREEYRSLDPDGLWAQQCRDQRDRSPGSWITNGFCHVHKPGLDDEPFRAFSTLADYREWCDEALPDYLGFRRVETWPPTANAAR